MTMARDMAWGGAGFALAALVLKPLSMMGWGIPDQAWVFAGLGVLSAGVLEEGTRALLLTGLRPNGRALVGFALGWALAELMIVGVAGSAQLLILGQDPGAMASAREAMPAPAAQALQRQVEALSGWALWTLPLERGVACLLQIGFTALMAKALFSQHSKRSHTGAAVASIAALHAIVNLPAAGFQAGLWSLAPVQVIYGVLGLVIAPAVWRWSRAPFRPAPAATIG